ncbi:interferon-inducible double-stranded RNA-dependent protein kinase activator A homolog [Amia ocellicauda]|uniref:interferon-inducible double-stranded RNA-dependent protein kinase activator A homolog n=1 Tax=Amia ocellicauda TaxID=2972642 RepID=UPI003464A0F3
MSQERRPAAAESSPAEKQLSSKEIMTAWEGKTPIQILQEYGTKIGKTPLYVMEKAEGQAHLPSFIFSVAVGEIKCTGHGHSKKAAKHKAAEAALNVLKGESCDRLAFPKIDDPDAPKDPQNQPNPIGILQELAVQRGWRLPEYSVAMEAGPPHKREFAVTCRIERFVETGNGSSKKIAKRAAAEVMFAKLQNLPETTDIPRLPKTNFRLESLRSSSEEKITMLKRNPLSIPNTDYVQMMSELSKEQGFEVTYIDIDELTVNGQYQCLAQLSTAPVTVCHGTGISCGNAHNDAAHSALQYVKFMAETK